MIRGALGWLPALVLVPAAVVVGIVVTVPDDDLAELPSTSSREIAVEKFVPSDQIDPMLFEKSYYLEPEKSGAKPYALLR